MIPQIGVARALVRRVILAQAVAQNLAPNPAAAGLSLASCAKPTAAGDAFHSVLKGSVSALSSDASLSSATSSQQTEMPQEDQNQGSGAAVDPAPNPILLTLFGLTSLQILPAGVSTQNSNSIEQDSLAAAGTRAIPASTLNGTATNQDADPAPTNDKRASELQPDASAAAVSLSTAPAAVETIPVVVANQNLIPDSPRAGVDSAGAPAAAERLEAATVHASPSTPMQPVFTLTIRTEDQQEQPVIPQQPDSPQPLSATGSSSIVPSVAQNIIPASASNGSTGLSPLQNNASTNTVESAAAATPSTATMIADFAGSTSDGKSGDEQTGDRQSMAATLIESFPSDPTTGAQTQFQISESRPVTEHVDSEPAASVHANAPVSDIRLQIAGAANQHVDVRLVQQADGLRVSVRSSDPVLTQSLQEHVPELTARLEQHHYQTDVFLPDHNDLAHVSQANPGTNLQQDSSGRNHRSADQGNPQNKQNQQQKQQEIKNGFNRNFTADNQQHNNEWNSEQ